MPPEILTSSASRRPLRILILGASYGSLLAIKALAAGHHVTMTCRTSTAVLMNIEGIKVRLPIKGRKDLGNNGLLEIDSRTLPGLLVADTPAQVGDLSKFDLVVLAMQEPQYHLDGIRQLMYRIGESKLPCMPIMNMPPLPYLTRLAKHSVALSGKVAIDLTECRSAYADASVWDHFDPANMTLSSPDPQAFRPPGEPVNVLHVGLPTNFKTAPFENPAHTEMLKRLEADIEAVRYRYRHADGKEESLELPVKLKVHDSLFVPLAKWSMLLTGNYRCIGASEMRPIQDAVLSDKAQSEQIYNWVCELCYALGAKPEDLVPFEKYAAAANGLLKPSSVARALLAGALEVERVDWLVRNLALAMGRTHESVNQTVALVDGWLKKNRTSQPITA